MMTQEVSSVDWREFCERFVRMQRDSLITVELINPERGNSPAVIAREVPLRRMEFKDTQGCNNRIEIEMGGPAEEQICHTIIEPIHVTLQEESDQPKIMRIEAENGTTFVKFHSGRIGKLLEGLRLA
jgi:hypothetical protein